MTKNNAGSSVKSMRISVECSCKSHLVHVNEQFEFIVSSNRKQKLKVVISQDGEAILKELTVILTTNNSQI